MTHTLRHAHPLVSAILLTVLVAAGLPALAENTDPEQNGSQYAWSENAGWLNAEPLGDGGPGVEVTEHWLSGWIWGENIGWISLSCENTSSCGTVDFGVENDGCGDLDGMAWSENAGWIDFGPSHGGVLIDTLTGEFSGHAWSENLGWISFGGDHRIVTDWRPAPVTGFIELHVDKLGTVTQLDWSPLPDARAYDVSWGDLGVLRSSGGDLAEASHGCLVDDWDQTTYEHPDVPDPGAGFWYLVRGDSCGPAGTYDAGAGTEDHPRDEELGMHPEACS
jgi:hypothetical protein